MTNHNEPAWYTAVMCPIPTCYLTSTHMHSAEAVAVAKCMAHIRREFDSRRDFFLEDPGGALDYVAIADDPATNFPDEIAAKAIGAIRAEWTPVEVNGADMLKAVRAATHLPAYIEHTGGGCATIYVGEVTRTPITEGVAKGMTEDRYTLAIGPGHFGGYDDPTRSRFVLTGDDLWIGPDNDGADYDNVRGASTLEEVTTAVREVLRALGHGEAVTA